MAIASGDLDPVQLNVRLHVAEVMAATVIAAIVRAGNPRILDELRRNVLAALKNFETTDDQAAVLSHEVATDGLIDEIVRLSRQS